MMGYGWKSYVRGLIEHNILTMLFFWKNIVYEPSFYESPKKQENFKVVQSDAFNGLKKKPQKLIIRTLR